MEYIFVRIRIRDLEMLCFLKNASIATVTICENFRQFHYLQNEILVKFNFSKRRFSIIWK